MKGENEYIIISKNLFSFSSKESGREERGNKKDKAVTNPAVISTPHIRVVVSKYHFSSLEIPAPWKKT